MGLIGGVLRRFGRVILDISVVLLVVVLLPGLPPNVKYSYYEADESLPFEGPLAKNDRLNEAGRLLDGKIIGPESIASRSKHELFTSLHNGKILRIWGRNFDHFQSVVTIGPGCDGPWQEKICGRPLGLRFAPDGRLIVVDAYLGLFALNVDTGEKERLFDPTEPIDGAVPLIPDDLDIDEDGNIYWSDASSVGDLSDGLVEMMSDPSGRLIKYDSKTLTNKVLVKDVHFANGVQLSPDRDFVLFCETFKSRIMRHWLNGPNAGQTDVFVDKLPGKPDNIRARKDGGYYVSLIAVDNKEKPDLTKILARFPLVRKLILRLLGIPKFLFDSISKLYPNQFTENISYKIYHLQPIANLIASNVAIVVELDAEGNIESSLQGDNGNVRFISETEQVGDYLFFGSPYNSYLGYLRVDFSDEEEEEEPSLLEVDGEGIKIKLSTGETGKEVEEEEEVEKKVQVEEVKKEEGKKVQVEEVKEEKEKKVQVEEVEKEEEKKVQVEEVDKEVKKVQVEEVEKEKEEKVQVEEAVSDSTKEKEVKKEEEEKVAEKGSPSKEEL